MQSEQRPHYRKPPVIEVVCAMQFPGIEGWGTPHYGTFWRHIEQDFPEFEDRPPLATLSLDFNVSIEPQIVPTFLPPLRRVFFIKPPGNYLIQLQPNKLLYNWRKLTEADQYPRYEQAYSGFLKAYQRFSDFLTSVSLNKPHPELFEITYINHISHAGTKFPRDVWDYLAFYEQTPKAMVAKESSAVSMQFVWPLPNEMGLLTLDLKHGVRPNDEREVLVMELTARGKNRDHPTYMDQWFGVAHSAIVNTFDSFTTDKAHALWEKYEI